MVKEIEKTGIPVVHMCTVVPISKTVGANRIVPTIAIPHPLGNPSLDAKETPRKSTRCPTNRHQRSNRLRIKKCMLNQKRPATGLFCIYLGFFDSCIIYISN